MCERCKSRTWTDGEKLEICRQTTVPGVSVGQVARRYSVNANMIFKWLKDVRYMTSGGVSASDSDAGFLPVDFVSSAHQSSDTRALSDSVCLPLCAHRIDITLSDGRRVLVEGPTSLSAILGLVQGLAI